MKASTGCRTLCGVGQYVEKLGLGAMHQKVLVWPSLSNVVIYQDEEERNVGRNHYFCFRHVDFVMTLNRYLSRDVIVGSWDSEKMSYLEKCLTH